MPFWLISILVNLAIKLGLPWLLKMFPWIPSDVQGIIEKLVADLESHAQVKTNLVDAAKTEVKAVCTGNNCSIEQENK